MASSCLSTPLECTVCITPYDDTDHEPKLLACHHTLCVSCIVQLAKGNNVKCPTKCKMVTILPKLSAQEQAGTPNERLVRRVKKLQHSFYIKCMQENERFYQNALKQNQIKQCSEHNETLNVWCKSCFTIVCVKCQFTSHKGHDHDLLESVVETFKDDINKTIGRIETEKQKMQSENFCLTRQRVMRTIDADFKEIRIDLLKILDNKQLEIKKQLNLTLDESLSTRVASLDSLRSIYQQTVSSDDVLMLVQMSNNNELDSRLNQLLQQSRVNEEDMAHQTRQYSNGIKQEMLRIVDPTEVLTVQDTCADVQDSFSLSDTMTSQQNANKRTSSASNEEMPPKMICRETNNSMPKTFHSITNKPVTKIGCTGSEPEHEQFKCPEYTALDSSGTLYVSDSGNYRIKKLNPEGGYITHWRTSRFQPGQLAVNNDQYELVCAKIRKANYTNQIIIYSLDGQVKRDFTVTGMKKIGGVAVNRRGRIVCTDCISHIICVVNQNGELLHRIGSEGPGCGQFNVPHGVCIGPDDDILVADTCNYRIQILDNQGAFKQQIGTEGDKHSQFKEPVSVAVDQYNQILVSDYGRKDIQVFSYSGNFITCIDSADDKMLEPWSLAVTRDHHVFIADFSSHCIFKFRYM